MRPYAKVFRARRRSVAVFCCLLMAIAVGTGISMQQGATAVNCASKVFFFPNDGDDNSAKIGSANATTQKVCVPDSHSVPVPAFTRDGFNLWGWTQQPDELASNPDLVPGLSAVSTSWQVVDTITAVFAQWQPKQYSIAYDLDGGTGAPTSVTRDFGSNIYVGATVSGDTFSFNAPTKVGFNFTGWSIGTEEQTYSQGQKFTLPSRNITFKAKWAAK